MIQHNTLLRIGIGTASAKAASNTNTNTKTSLSATTTTTTTTTATTTKRIFCFGDSLTAGTAPPSYELFPYAKHLETALNRLRRGTTGGTNGTSSGEPTPTPTPTPAVQVRWKGYPGWTAPALLQDGGLSDFLERAAAVTATAAATTTSSSAAEEEETDRPAIDLVIVLAGTNDLGYAKDAGDVFEAVRSIHELALAEKGRVGRTVALSIPTSAWQSHTPAAEALASEVNARLEEWAETTTDSAVTFVPFPIEEYDRDSGLWAPDGLHFFSGGIPDHRRIARSGGGAAPLGEGEGAGAGAE
eukprot:jgi/Psemu1/292216/fgenesh1_pg.957_\